MSQGQTKRDHEPNKSGTRQTPAGNQATRNPQSGKTQSTNKSNSTKR